MLHWTEEDGGGSTEGQPEENIIAEKGREMIELVAEKSGMSYQLTIALCIGELLSEIGHVLPAESIAQLPSRSLKTLSFLVI